MTLSEFPIGAKVRPWCIGLNTWDHEVNTILEKNSFYVLTKGPDGTLYKLVPSLEAINS